MVELGRSRLSGALHTFLYRHRTEYPRRYRLQGREHRLVRILLASEVNRAPRQFLRGWLP